jgi:hypothetical protein
LGSVQLFILYVEALYSIQATKKAHRLGSPAEFGKSFVSFASLNICTFTNVRSFGYKANPTTFTQDTSVGRIALTNGALFIMEKEINMQTQQATQTEIKSIAKGVKASLARSGYPVPHTAILTALAATLNRRDWQTLKAALEQKPLAQSAPALNLPPRGDTVPYGPYVEGSFCTGDHAFTKLFDARLGLMEASDDILLSILDNGYSGSSPDNVLVATVLPAETAFEEGLSYARNVSLQNNGKPIGFEVNVNRAQFLTWLDECRKPVIARSLCEKACINAYIVGEDEFQAWAWEESNGKLHISSGSDESDALVEAYDALGLLELEID